MIRANFNLIPTPSIDDFGAIDFFARQENLGGDFGSDYDFNFDFSATANWLDFPQLEVADDEISPQVFSTVAPPTIFRSESNLLNASAIDLVGIRQPFIRVSPPKDVTEVTSQQAIGENPAFDLIGLTQLRNDPQFAGIDGSGFSVAIIDTGVDINHRLIAPNYVAGYDFVDRDNDPSDPVGHGTHIAGTIGAIDETIGVATDAGLIGLRTLDRNGEASVSTIETALEWVYDNRQRYNITAVNLSLGAGFFTPESLIGGDILSDNIRDLEAAGVTVVGAAGNNYFSRQADDEGGGIAFPAVFSTIAVGAVWQDDSEPLAIWQDGSIDYTTGADRIPGFSQRSSAENFIFAPGAIITSTLPDDKIGENAGTSQAVPHIAGTVALLQEASVQFGDRVLTPAEVREILRSTGDRIFDGDDEDDNVTNTETSYIRVNVYNAIAEIKRRNQTTVLSTGSLDDTISQVEVPTALPLRGRTAEIGRDGEEQVGERDADFYLFNPDEAGILELEVDASSASPLDSVITLFDSQGRRLAMQDDNSSNNSRLRFQVDANTDYYAVVTGSGNQNFDPFIAGSGTKGDTGIYSLNADLRSLADNASLIDNTLDSPGVQTVTIGQTLFGNLGNDSGYAVGNNDIDLYRFTPTSSESVQLETIANEQFSADTYLRLFDAPGQELAANNDISSDNRGSSIQFTAIAGREYYIGVNGNSAASRDYNPLTGANQAAGSQGDYSLRLSRSNETGFRATTENSVYQFRHRDTGANFYTASVAERDYVAGNLERYTLAGTSFESATDSLTGAKPIYRFFNTGTGAHLYTISEIEKNYIEDNLFNYNSEGIAYYGYEDRQPGTIPLYRLYNTKSDTHFFTSSVAEKNEISENNDNHRLEGNNGIAFYVESIADV